MLRVSLWRVSESNLSKHNDAREMLVRGCAWARDAPRVVRCVSRRAASLWCRCGESQSHCALDVVRGFDLGVRCVHRAGESPLLRIRASTAATRAAVWRAPGSVRAEGSQRSGRRPERGVIVATVPCCSPVCERAGEVVRSGRYRRRACGCRGISNRVRRIRPWRDCKLSSNRPSCRI